MRFILFIFLFLVGLRGLCQNPDGFFSKIDPLLIHDIPEVEFAENYLLIDVREKEEFDISHFKGAIHKDFQMFDENWMGEFQKSDSLLFYCSVSFRSEIIAQRFKKEGFDNVFNLKGGLFNYVNNGGDLVDQNGESTKSVHGYNREWSLLLNADRVLVQLPSVKFSDVIYETMNSFSGFFGWAISEFTFQTQYWYVNYFLWLLIISTVVFTLEVAFPWRKNQKLIRKDFWMDFIYMFLNFYVFAFVLKGGFTFVWWYIQYLGFDPNTFAVIDLSILPLAVGLILFFLINDLVQWFTHRILHRFDFLWQFHKVHHSVKEMGFAAHLRYHWMENVFYRPLKTLVVLLLVGLSEPEMAFIVHYISIAIGHFNHANIGIDYGPFKYVINNPKMHIWHHSKVLPDERRFGVNFGISLSFWDYIFGTAYIPSEGRDIELGFDGDENFPKDILNQSIYPINSKD